MRVNLDVERDGDNEREVRLRPCPENEGVWSGIESISNLSVLTGPGSDGSGPSDRQSQSVSAQLAATTAHSPHKTATVGVMTARSDLLRDARFIPIPMKK